MKTLKTVLIICMVVSVLTLGACERRTGQEKEIVEIPTISENESSPEITVGEITPNNARNIESVLDMNNDVVGYLQVPNTSIDDVVVFNDESNEYYKRRDLYALLSLSSNTVSRVTPVR